MSHTIVEIIEKEPHLIEDIPNALQRIVRKTLAKDREMRYHTAKDLFIDLKNLKRELDLAGELERSITPEQTATDGEKETQIYSADPQETGTGEAASTKTITSESSLEYAVNQAKSHKATTFSIIGILVIAASAVFGYFYLYSTTAAPLTDKDVILITDFDNKTGEEVFDGTLKLGLTMAFQQSPFLSIFPEAEAHETLKLMKRDPKEKITKELGREISQRKGLKAFVTGTLKKLGSAYVLGLEAINTQTGETIAFVQAQADADDQKNVLDAISKAATEMRGKLGESVAQIEKFDKRFRDATTSSLEALKVFQTGRELEDIGKNNEANALFKRSVEIDPEFARGHLGLFNTHTRVGQTELAMESLVKAFKLRDKVSEREKIILDEYYYAELLGDSHKAIEVLETGKQMYPRDGEMRSDLGIEYARIGEHEKALVEAEEALKLDPNNSVFISVLAYRYLILGRFAEAKETIEIAGQKGFEGPSYHFPPYIVALAEDDAETMEKELRWFKGRVEWLAFALRAETAGFRGQAKKSVEFERRSISLLGRAGNKDVQAQEFNQLILRQALLGRCSEVRSLFNESPELIFHFRPIMFKPLALVLCDESTRAKPLIDEAIKKNPKATRIHRVWIPVIDALAEMKKGNPEKAVTLLDQVKGYERSGGPDGIFFVPQYLRGKSYLAMNETDKAKAEFQTILENRMWSPFSPLYPLAQLGKARAMKSKKEYEKFFEMWKDADKDLPALIAAKKEYAALN